MRYVQHTLSRQLCVVNQGQRLISYHYTDFHSFFVESAVTAGMFVKYGSSYCPFHTK